MKEDCLIEIHTEELPPKALLNLSKAFEKNIAFELEKVNLTFGKIKSFATPRRLAVLIEKVDTKQLPQMMERKGPSYRAAFDDEGNPTKACIGFAKSLGVTPNDLKRIKTDEGDWVGFMQVIPGKTVQELLPTIVETAASLLPIPKRMRWGNPKTEFVRPVHGIVLLFGKEIIEDQVLGLKTGNMTHGHRFHTKEKITIPSPKDYENTLESKAFIIPSFNKRRTLIQENATALIQKKLGKQAHILFDKELLDEVTALVEWPVILCGHFDEHFLQLPKEVLISSMQDHQRYFPIVDDQNNLMPYFIVVSNIESKDPDRVIHGNERVIRARLSDADFFYQKDKEVRLDSRIQKLSQILYRAKLGTLYDKTERLSKLGAFIARKIEAPTDEAERAGLLAKTDLTTEMVGEFPELQGIMGYYYARNDNEKENVALAIREHYLPRFAKDELPGQRVSQAIALADRVDLLMGAFSIKQIPTGDKDPFGLRRAALGIIRIIIEKEINIDLEETLAAALSFYIHTSEIKDPVGEILTFIQERLRAWYQEKGITPDAFAAVNALSLTNLLDFDQRIKAVQQFKQLNESESLSIANKRVSNILSKYEDTIQARNINPAYSENAAEKLLAEALEKKSKTVRSLYETHQYTEALVELADLRAPVDNFFDAVMVMTDNQAQRENRILMLSKLRSLFLKVADIALLQTSC